MPDSRFLKEQPGKSDVLLTCFHAGKTPLCSEVRNLGSAELGIQLHLRNELHWQYISVLSSCSVRRA